jgi:hypothetical protein
MRFDFIRPGAQWPNEIVPGAGDWRSFDVNQSKSVNGDLGGTWNPTSPIVLGGRGIWVPSSGSGGAVIGGVLTKTGGRIMQGASSDVPTLSPTQTRVECVPMLSVVQYDPANGVPTQLVLDDVNGWGVKVFGEVGSLYYTYFEIPGRYIHSGARFAGFEIDFVVTQRPTALPANGVFATWVSSDDTGTTAETANPSSINIELWTAGHAVTLTSVSGEYWAPSSDSTNVGYYYSVTALGGTPTTTTEPTWPTTVGATVSDSNGNTWTCVGKSGWYPMSPAVTSIASYYNDGAPQTLELDTDGTVNPATSLITNVMDVSQRYNIILTHSDPTVLYTAIRLYYDSIGSMAFE